MTTTVFLVDDDALQLKATAQTLRERHGCHVITALGGKAAIEYFLLRSKPFPDVVLLDLIMPEVSGADVVKSIRLSDANIPIVLLAPPEQKGLVMEAIRAGANDCLQKPANSHYVKLTIDRHVQKERMRVELSRLQRYQRSHFRFEDIIGQSDVMQRCLNQAKEASRQLMPLAIDGPQGAGKELMARVIHSQGSIRHGRFVSVACEYDNAFAAWLDAWQEGAAAWPEMLGDPKDGATLFLHHLDEMPMALQEKLAALLLHIRQSASPAFDKLRLVASTCKPLAQLCRNGRLHEKLFYYFDAHKISVPALSQRGDDVLLLANYYLQRFTATHPFLVERFDASGEKMLREKKWNGNVMELMTLMQRAAYYAHEELLGSHILNILIENPSMPAMSMSEMAHATGATGAPGDYRLLNSSGEMKSLEEIEADVIRFAIHHYRGKMTEVARKLGIGRSTLYRKMQDYKMREPV